MTIALSAPEIALQTYEGEVRADSRQLAERMDVQHESVMRLISSYQERFERFAHLRFEIGTVKNSVGAVNQTRFALLNEDQCYFLLTLIRNNDTTVQMKNDLVAAFGQFRRMAHHASAPALPTYPEALRQLAAKLEENDLLQQQLEEAKPKLYAYDAFMESDGLISIANAAKLLGEGPLKLFEFLRSKGYLMTGSSNPKSKNVPYQKHIDNGLFRVKTSVSRDGQHNTVTPYLTTKGLEHMLQKHYPNTQLPLLEVAGD